MSRKRIVAGVVISVLALLVGSALALTNINLLLGTIPSYDFGTSGPGYPVPGTVQIHAFTMNPGDQIPWHYHKGLSYVILVSGTITEQHQVGAVQCESEVFGKGTAFVEGPGQVHTVTNTGTDTAVIWWATVFPKSDGIVQFGPGFRVGGVYPATVPNCSALN